MYMMTVGGRRDVIFDKTRGRRGSGSEVAPGVFAMGVSGSGSFTCRNLLSNYVDTELFSPILGPTWGGGGPHLFSPFSRVFGNNVPAVQP